MFSVVDDLFSLVTSQAEKGANVESFSNEAEELQASLHADDVTNYPNFVRVVLPTAAHMFGDSFFSDVFVKFGHIMTSFVGRVLNQLKHFEACEVV